MSLARLSQAGTAKLLKEEKLHAKAKTVQTSQRRRPVPVRTEFV